MLRYVNWPMKNIYVIGKPFLEQTKSLLDMKVVPHILIDKKYLGVKFKGMNLFKTVHYLDFSSKKKLLSDLEKLDLKIDGLICLYENYLVPKAWIENFYGLSGSEAIEVAEDMTDKLRMREKFEKYDSSLNPDFREIKTLSELKSFADSHQFPLILKPANLVKSLLISKSMDWKELEENYERMVKEIDKTYEKYGFSQRKPRIIVEEFMVGTQHSVAGFVDHLGEVFLVGEVVDLVSANNIGINDQHLFARMIPSSLSEKIQKEILEVARKGLKALGLRKSPAHIEIMLTAEGPKIIEIAPRIGGYRAKMYKLIGGADLQKVEVDIQLKKKINLGGSANKFCCVLELFPEKSGIFVEIENWEKLANLKSLFHAKIKSKAGDKVGYAKDGYKSLATITLLHENQKILAKDLEFIRNNIQIITRPKAIKVAHLLPYSAIYPLKVHHGRYQWVLDLAERQTEAGLDVTIFTNSQSRIKNPKIKTGSIKQDFGSLAKNNEALMTEALGNESSDVFHSHFDNLHYKFARLTQKPIVYTQHWAVLEKTLEMARQFVAKNVYAIPLSEFQYKFNKKFKLQTLTKIYHGVDLGSFKFSDKKPGNRYLYVGKICAQKGIKEAVEFAYKNRLKLDIIGKINEKDKSYWESFNALVDGKIIKYLGPQKHSQINIFMQKAKTLLFPIQSQEAFGLTVIEALASGCPVLTLDCGHMKEIISNGINGFVAKDMNSLKKLSPLVDKIPRKDCRKSALNFSIDQMVENYTLAYFKLLAIDVKSDH